MEKESFQVVLITAAKIEEAERIANVLVEERLAACINLIERCRSVYRWKGEIVHDEEVLMIVKTDRAHFSMLRKRVLELHSYENPEIIALDIQAGSQPYLDFLNEALGT